MRETTVKRCAWSELNERNRRYHDVEWGVPNHDDQKQFEHLSMEVLQCGLNWDMMLQKRAIFNDCFAGFDIDAVAGFTENDVTCILATEGMIRSQRKVEAVIQNAKMIQEIQETHGSFSDYLWDFTNRHILIYRDHAGEFPTKNALSEKISTALKEKGFKFIGPVTIYAHLQACGIINDHDPECFRYYEVTKSHPVRYLTEEEPLATSAQFNVRHC